MANAYASAAALHAAAERGDLAAAEQLLLRGVPVDAYAAHRQGYTPLHRAAFHGHIDIVQLLVRAHAAVDEASTYADESGWTALQLAVNSGHAAVVQLLLDAGAAWMLSSQQAVQHCM